MTALAGLHRFLPFIDLSTHSFELTNPSHYRRQRLYWPLFEERRHKYWP